MAKRKTKKPIPLTAIENLKYNFPDIENCEQDFTSVYNFCVRHEIPKSTLVVHTMLKWKKTKQIFEIDKELCSLLMDVDKLDEAMPSEVFDRLIYDCFYVKLPDNFLVQRNGGFDNEDIYSKSVAIDGFYYTVNGTSVIIGIMYETLHMQTIGFDFDKEKTLRECMDAHLKCSNDVYKVINFFIQIVLYLCADNADIQENYIHKEMYKPPKPNEKPQDTVREVRKWEVGYRYGAAIKKERQAERNRTYKTTTEAGSREGSHARKRTHIRRGHYHHFWSGSEKDGTKKLTLKWVSPIVINAEYENVTTIRKVK